MGVGTNIKFHSYSLVCVSISLFAANGRDFISRGHKQKTGKDLDLKLNQHQRQR